MAGENYIPDRTINYQIYDSDNNALIGVGTVDLPSMEKMTETVSGAGIAGEVETVIQGHFSSQSATIHWNSITEDGLKLLNDDSNSFTCRAAVRKHNTSGAKHGVTALRVMFSGQTKTSELGSVEVNGKLEMTTEVEVAYMAVYWDDVKKIELDKFNMVYSVNGEDMLSDVRKAMGLS